MNKLIDLRSDVLTVPTAAMWEAMQQAKPGWSHANDDATVNELEALAAARLGKEAALFAPTCTMANLLALMSQAERGSQIILEATSHIAWAEEWSLAAICGLFPRLLPSLRGVLEPAAVEAAIAVPQFGHHPPTGLVCLENTHNNAGGIAVTVEQTQAIAAVSHRYGVPVHLDGARIFNAAAALGREARELAAPVDSVSFSLNKGLRAPFGAMLCGPAGVIEKARINIKRLGAGSIHKANLFAAAGLVAVSTMTGQVAHDNRRAGALAQQLAQVPGLSIDLTAVQTNIVKATVTRDGLTAREFVSRLAARNVLALDRSSRDVRFVTHAGIDDDDIQQSVAAIAGVLG